MIDIKTTAIDVATLTPLIIPVSMIIFYLLTFNFTWIYFVILFLTNSGVNAVLKKLFSGSKFNWAKRPVSSDDCCSTLKKNCGIKSPNNSLSISSISDDLIDKIKDVEKKYNSKPYNIELLFDNIISIIQRLNLSTYQSKNISTQSGGGDVGIKGFPSGHSQTICLFATFFCIYLYTHSSSYLKFLPISIIIIISILVMLSRKLVGCHTPLQIGVGGAIGIILGIAGYIGYHYIPTTINTDVEVIQPDYTTYLLFFVFAIAILFISIVIISAI